MSIFERRLPLGIIVLSALAIQTARPDIVFQSLGGAVVNDSSTLDNDAGVFSFDINGDSLPDIKFSNAYRYDNLGAAYDRKIDIDDYWMDGGLVSVSLFDIPTFAIKTPSNGVFPIQNEFARFSGGSLISSALGQFNVSGSGPAGVSFEYKSTTDPEPDVWVGLSNYFGVRGYIPFSWRTSFGQPHYGWIDVSLSGGTNFDGLVSRSLFLHGIAWQTDTNVPIAAGGISQRWNGNLNGSWDSGVSQNWQGPSAFQVYNDAIFDDTASGTHNVTIAGGNVLAGGMIKVDTSSSYSITSAAGSALSGTAHLRKLGSGSLTLGGPASYTGGTQVFAGSLRTGTSNALPDIGAVSVANGATLNFQGNAETIADLTANGSVLLGGGAVNIASLAGSTGSIDLGNGALTINQSGNTTYSGTIIGTGGTVIKEGVGTLNLSWVNTFTGGLTIKGGRVNSNGSSAGVGGVTVMTGGVFKVSGNLEGGTNAMLNLAGGTASIAADLPNAAAGGLTVSADSGLQLFDVDSPSITGDFVLSGTLHGSANLSVSASSTVAGADAADGLRLRGVGASSFSGTVLVARRTKLELQSATAGNFSPLGTGRVILSAGTATGLLNGTYSQLQTNLTSNNLTTAFNNDVEIAGTGVVNFKALGNAGTTASFGNLKIGSGQSAFFNKNDTTARTLAFSSVTLTGGNATFSVLDPSFGSTNTPTGPSVSLGSIGESTQGAGVIFKASGAPHVTITGIATYTGPTEVASGTLSVGASGSIANSSQVLLSSAGSKLDVAAFASGYAIPSSQTLAGIGDWDGRLILDGIISPGVGSGIGTMAGDNLTINGGGTLRFNLSALDSAADRLSLSGTLTKGIGGPFQFDFEGGGASGVTYALVQFSSTTLLPSDLSYTDLGAGLTGSFVVSATDLKLVVIPEPNSALLVSISVGAMAFGGVRRRDRVV